MTGKSSFIYSDEFLNYQFGPNHPFKPIRCKMTLELLKKLNIFDDKARIIIPQRASNEDLRLVHTQEYIDFVRRECEEGYGFLDSGDTPSTKGLFEAACAVVGGSILGAKRVADGEDSHAFNVGGGLHHAKPDAAAGFCVFNDIAIAARWLQKNKGIHRIAIVDIDGHHGDGTQAIFYNEPVLKISSQRIGIFPNTGYVREVGEGAGRGYSVNIPLPKNTGDDAYLFAYNEIVPPLLRWYKPEIILFQCGIDGHAGDPLVGLSLTSRTYEAVVNSMHDLAHALCDGRLLIFGGGGYDVNVTARCWALAFATVSQAIPRTKYSALLNDEETKNDPALMSTVRDTVEQIKETVFRMNGLF
jgi:acetoin utilization protein AcuC